MIPYRDDKCPNRGPGLSHMAEAPTYVCYECNVQCLIESVVVQPEDMPRIAVFINEPDCLVDHDSLISALTDENYYPRCPNCWIQVEPRYEPLTTSPTWQSARGKELEFAKLAYMKWYYSNRVEP